MFGIFGWPNGNKELIEENRQLRKELTEIRQRQVLTDLLRPYRENQQTIGLGAGIWRPRQIGEKDYGIS